MDDETAKRINIDDLAKPEKELSDDEEKDVTGGGGANFALGDGSVRFVSNSVSSTNPIESSLTDEVKKG